MCSSTPVSVADRLAHAQQLRGFNHVIFTQSRDAQQLFNLVRDWHRAREGSSLAAHILQLAHRSGIMLLLGRTGYQTIRLRLVHEEPAIRTTAARQQIEQAPCHPRRAWSRHGTSTRSKHSGRLRRRWRWTRPAPGAGGAQLMPWARAPTGQCAAARPPELSCIACSRSGTYVAQGACAGRPAACWFVCSRGPTASGPRGGGHNALEYTAAASRMKGLDAVSAKQTLSAGSCMSHAKTHEFIQGKHSCLGRLQGSAGGSHAVSVLLAGRLPGDQGRCAEGAGPRDGGRRSAPGAPRESVSHSCNPDPGLVPDPDPDHDCRRWRANVPGLFWEPRAEWCRAPCHIILTNKRHTTSEVCCGNCCM